MKHYSRRKKIFLIPVFILAAAALMGFIVMSLWNHILVDVIHVSPVSFWQALGILVLSKILFSGFRGAQFGRHQWKQRMQEKWATMTPEEKEKFRSEWKARCMGRRFSPETFSPETPAE